METMNKEGIVEFEEFAKAFWKIMDETQKKAEIEKIRQDAVRKYGLNEVRRWIATAIK